MAWSSPSFVFVCSSRPRLRGSIQLYGAAVLLGLLGCVVVLARPHQAVQQVSYDMKRQLIYQIVVCQAESLRLFKMSPIASLFL